jgi:NTE family protein
VRLAIEADGPGEPLSFLEGLTPEERAAVTARFEPVAVAGGDTLFREGDAADALYVVVSGSIGISVLDGSGRARRLARVAPPETVGELAFLADGARSATATALRDARLLRLTRGAFEDLARQVPGLMPYLARLLARRMHAGVAGPSPGARRPGTFAVLAVTEGVDVQLVARGLARAAGP